MWQHLQMEVGYSHSGHIVTGRWLLSCMPVECWVEVRLPSSSWSGKGSVGLSSRLLDCDWQHFVGLSLLKLSSASACSTQDWPSPAPPHLHGSRYIRGGPLRGASLYAGCTGAGCRGLTFLLGDPVGLTGCDLRPPGQFYPCQVGTFV